MAPGDPAAWFLQRAIRDNHRHARMVRPDVALGQIGVRLEVLVGEQARLPRRERAQRRELVDLTVAGHQREPDLAVDVERDALQEIGPLDAEVLRHAVDAGQVRA